MWSLERVPRVNVEPRIFVKISILVRLGIRLLAKSVCQSSRGVVHRTLWAQNLGLSLCLREGTVTEFGAKHFNLALFQGVRYFRRVDWGGKLASSCRWVHLWYLGLEGWWLQPWSHIHGFVKTPPLSFQLCELGGLGWLLWRLGRASLVDPYSAPLAYIPGIHNIRLTHVLPNLHLVEG